jgi:hypothetical protein
MPHMHPLDFAAPDGVGDEIQGIARYTPASLYAGCLEGFYDYVGNSLGHLHAP